MKRNILVIGGVVVLMLLLAGAAFVGGKLINGQGAGFNLPFGMAGNAKAHQGIYLQVQRAKEIRPVPQSAIGAFIRRSGNSLFIGVGKKAEAHSPTQGGNVAASTGYASEIEVVVAHDTRVYRDGTGRQFTSRPQNGQKVQQVVEPGQIAEIGADSTVQVWGQQDGSRISAEVLLYTIPSYLLAGVPKP